MNNAFWPRIDDLWSAKKACIQASSVAILVGIVSGLLTYLNMKGSPTFGINQTSFIDAAIFLILGFFVYHSSRIASLVALILYAGGQIMMIPETKNLPVSGIFFSLLLIGGIRGSFAYHEMKKGLSKEEVKVTVKEQQEKANPTPSLPKRIFGFGILTLVVVVGVWLYKVAASQESSKSRATVENAAVKKYEPNSPKNSSTQSPEPAKPLPGEQIFKLKDGRTITGKVISDDPVYYTVETSSGRQEIVIKEDLAQ